MSLIYLVRHGETQDNREERLQGRKDTPLNDRGREQARLLNAYFAQASLEGIVTSPLARARETADIAGGGRFRIFIEPAFIARQLGDYEGLTVAELKARNQGEYEALKGDFQYCPPGGGESAATVAARALPKLHEWARYFLDRDFAIVTHAIVVKSLLHNLEGYDFKQLPMVNSNSAIHVLKVEDGTMRYQQTAYPDRHSLKSGME